MFAVTAPARDAGEMLDAASRGSDDLATGTDVGLVGLVEEEADPPQATSASRRGAEAARKVVWRMTQPRAWGVP